MSVWILSLSFLIVEPRILTFREIPVVLEAATGVRATKSNIKNYYDQNVLKFPQYGRASEITPAFLFSMISYGSMFCEGMIQKDKMIAPRDRRAHASIAFDRLPSSVTDEQLTDVFESYAQWFYQRSLREEERVPMLELFHKTQESVPDEASQWTYLLSTVCAQYPLSYAFLAYPEAR